MTFFFDNFWKREIFTFFHFFYKFWRFRKPKKMTNFQIFGVSPENDKIYPPQNDKKSTVFDRTSKSLPSDPRTTPRKSNFFLFFWKVRDFLFGPMRVGVSVGRTFWMTTSVGCSSIDHGEEFPDPSSFFSWSMKVDRRQSRRRSKNFAGQNHPASGCGGQRWPGSVTRGIPGSSRSPCGPLPHLLLTWSWTEMVSDRKLTVTTPAKKIVLYDVLASSNFFPPLKTKSPSPERVSKHSTILNFFCSPLEKILLLVSERSRLVTIFPHLSSTSFCFLKKYGLPSIYKHKSTKISSIYIYRTSSGRN